MSEFLQHSLHEELIQRIILGQEDVQMLLGAGDARAVAETSCSGMAQEGSRRGCIKNSKRLFAGRDKMNFQPASHCVCIFFQGGDAR